MPRLDCETEGRKPTALTEDEAKGQSTDSPAKRKLRKRHKVVSGAYFSLHVHRKTNIVVSQKHMLHRRKGLYEKPRPTSEGDATLAEPGEEEALGTAVAY